MAIPEGLSFDELNKLYQDEHEGDLRSLPFEQYFGEMDLSAEQREKRISAAKEIEKFTRLALASMYYMWQEGGYDYGDATTVMVTGYRSLIEKLGIPLTAFFAATHVESIAADIVSSTMNHPEDPYFYSEDRATLIAENESNSLYNDSEYQDAIMTGKTRKTWVAIIDKVTRDTHRDVNGTVVPIEEPFEVGDYMMMYPKDASMGAGPEEIVNCRCSVIYS